MRQRPGLGKFVLAALVVALGGCAARDTASTIDQGLLTFNYYVRINPARFDRFEVTLAASRVRRDSVDFVLPSWTPGRYGVAARHIVDGFRARDGSGRPIRARRLGEQTWRLFPHGAEYVNVEYAVVPGPPGEPLAFGVRVGVHEGYALGAGLLGTLAGFEQRPVAVTFDLPANWRVVAPLADRGNRFSAASYAALPGTPFVLGETLREFRLSIRGVDHAVVVSGADDDFEPDSLLTLVTETIDYGTRFLGRPPYRRYVFSVHFVPPEEGGIGATGQAAGLAVFLPMLESRRLRETGVGAVLLHQYLHAWFPGSFGPAALRRPDFRRPPVSVGTWLVEGVTEYYARLLPVRYGRDDRSAFYRQLGELLTLWYELGGGSRIDVAALERAIVAGGDDRAAARLIAGATLASFLIDLTIREETGGARGLDHLIYYLRERAPRDGFGDRIWRDAARALRVDVETLGPLGGAGPLSIEAGLARAGLRLVEAAERRRTLGARLEVADASSFVITGVEPAGTAASAGIRNGDRLVQINATPIGPDELVATRYALTTYIQSVPAGLPVRFEVLRDGRRISLQGTVRETTSRTARVEELIAVPAPARVVRSSLFEPGRPVPSR